MNGIGLLGMIVLLWATGLTGFYRRDIDEWASRFRRFEWTDMFEVSRRLDELILVDANGPYCRVCGCRTNHSQTHTGYAGKPIR